MTQDGVRSLVIAGEAGIEQIDVGVPAPAAPTCGPGEISACRVALTLESVRVEVDPAIDGEWFLEIAAGPPFGTEAGVQLRARASDGAQRVDRLIGVKSVLHWTPVSVGVDVQNVTSIGSAWLFETGEADAEGVVDCARGAVFTIRVQGQSLRTSLDTPGVPSQAPFVVELTFTIGRI